MKLSPKRVSPPSHWYLKGRGTRSILSIPWPQSLHMAGSCSHQAACWWLALSRRPHTSQQPQPSTVLSAAVLLARAAGAVGEQHPGAAPARPVPLRALRQNLHGLLPGQGPLLHLGWQDLRPAPADREEVSTHWGHPAQGQPADSGGCLHLVPPWSCPPSHRRARCQDVLKPDVLSQCQDTAEGEHQPQGDAGMSGQQGTGKAPGTLCHRPCTRCRALTLSRHRAGTAVATEKLVFGVEKNSTFLECLARSPQTTIRWLAWHGEGSGLSEVRGWQGGGTGRLGDGDLNLPVHQIRTGGHFAVLEQGLLIRQLGREDAGTYECQAVERSFSRPLTRYSLRVIQHEAMEVPPYRRSKGVEGPRTDPRALGAPGTSLDTYCNALWHQERQRQKAWHQKWQHRSPESKSGRVRRQPQAL